MPTPPHAREKIIAYGEERILDEIKGGDELTTIVGRIGISRGAFSDWMTDGSNFARVREARATASTWYDEQAMLAVRSARDNFESGKARDEAQHLRWRASKIAPKEYGDKQQVEGKFTVDWAVVAEEAAVKYAAKHKKPDNTEE